MPESTNGGQGIGVLLDRGDGIFAPTSFYNGGFSSSRVALGDLNNDGRLDVVTANSQLRTVGLLYSRGDGTFDALFQFSISLPNATSVPRRITTGDFAGDGYPDIVVATLSVTDPFVRVIPNVALSAGAEVSNAPIDLVANHLNVLAGIAFSDTMGSLNDNNPLSVAEDFTASIDWGDGQSSLGTIQKLPDGSYRINGLHTYATAGTFNISITLNEAVPFARYTAAGSAVATDAAANDVDAGPDQEVDEGTQRTLNGSFVNSDPLATPTYLWQVTSSHGQLVADGHALNVGASGAAFGLNNNALLTISELLLRINLRSRKGRVWDVDGNGTLSAAETILRNQAHSIFRVINSI